VAGAGGGLCLAAAYAVVTVGAPFVVGLGLWAVAGVLFVLATSVTITL